MQFLYRLLESNLVPDAVIRLGIRKMLAQKLTEEKQLCADSNCSEETKLTRFAEALKSQPIAIATAKANQQHYEVPTEFYKLVLGPHLKYSCAFWNEQTKTLRQAEEAMLKLTCTRADIADTGMKILELGCGWGSLSLWMAAQYPTSKILAISNSKTQKEYIDSQILERGLKNLEVRTYDINVFTTDEKFDRVVSVEMFEHLKNYELLFEHISAWLKPTGKLFVHIFAHKKFAYHYVNVDGNDWLTEYFFTGGMMPADNLFSYFQRDLKIEKQWRLNGSHYQKTCAAWLKNMDRNRSAIEPILAGAYGPGQVRRWWVYWRLFFLACEELFNFSRGEEWIVSHYLFCNRKATAR
ncbi:MAG: class I SAM-dependent methyltransferase [Cyanobacteria bacterium SZAS-4]|nr:class I SAM-dependent methyltransferase [Cyanobacteria bacterium SZAS-4]